MNGGRRRRASLIGFALVPGHRLVPGNADDSRCDAPAQVDRRSMMDELPHALDPSEEGGGPDGEGHTDSCDVLGAVVAVGVPGRCRAFGHPEPEEDQQGRAHV